MLHCHIVRGIGLDIPSLQGQDVSFGFGQALEETLTAGVMADLMSHRKYRHQMELFSAVAFLSYPFLQDKLPNETSYFP
jgi:hypothetical protein